MSKEELKQFIDGKQCVGYWEKLGGVEVHDIQHTAEGIVFFIKAGIMTSNPTYHRRTLVEFGMDGGHRDNVRVYNTRLYIDECLRLGGM